MWCFSYVSAIFTASDAKHANSAQRSVPLLAANVSRKLPRQWDSNTPLYTSAAVDC